MSNIVNGSLCGSAKSTNTILVAYTPNSITLAGSNGNSNLAVTGTMPAVGDMFIPSSSTAGMTVGLPLYVLSTSSPNITLGKSKIGDTFTPTDALSVAGYTYPFSEFKQTICIPSPVLLERAASVTWQLFTTTASQSYDLGLAATHTINTSHTPIVSIHQVSTDDTLEPIIADQFQFDPKMRFSRCYSAHVQDRVKGVPNYGMPYSTPIALSTSTNSAYMSANTNVKALLRHNSLLSLEFNYVQPAKNTYLVFSVEKYKAAIVPDIYTIEANVSWRYNT